MNPKLVDAIVGCGTLDTEFIVWKMRLFCGAKTTLQDGYVLADDGTSRYAHKIPIIDNPTPEDVRGKFVVGFLPLCLAAMTEEMITIEFTHCPNDTLRDLSGMFAAGAHLKAYRVHQMPQHEVDILDLQVVFDSAQRYTDWLNTHIRMHWLLTTPLEDQVEVQVERLAGCSPTVEIIKKHPNYPQRLAHPTPDNVRGKVVLGVYALCNAAAAKAVFTVENADGLPLYGPVSAKELARCILGGFCLCGYRVEAIQ